jgi:hypothetical protein
MTGRRFGRLVVLSKAKPTIRSNGQPLLRYRALCDCGRKTTVQGNNLRNGNTRSCGCIEDKPPGQFRLRSRSKANDA